MNRLLDIAFSSLGLLVTAVFYPFAAFAIKLETHGPVIVKLDRVSAGKIIKVYKFRTMVENAHAMKPLLKNLNERRDGPFFKIKNDKKIPAGRISPIFQCF